MRTIDRKEKKKRGCKYCMHVKHVRGELLLCPYEVCPFKDLDKFKSFDEYLKSDVPKLKFHEVPREFIF